MGLGGVKMTKKITKKIFVTVLMFAVALAGFLYLPKNVQAGDATVIKYQEVSNDVFIKKFANHEAPAYDYTNDNTNTGYLFAGWYKSNSNAEPITSAEGITGNVYAKFIPSYLTRIACQVDMNEGATTRNLRVVSIIDSTNYKAVGFNVYGRYDADKNGTNETEWLMYAYSSDAENPNVAESTKVYTGLNEYDENNNKTTKTPAQVFGAAAEGFFFTTISLTNIGERTNPNTQVTYDFKDATMAVKPYWITLDGTYVEGVGEFNRVNDYANEIVNVSVNLKDATDIAAGMLNITVPAGFTVQEVECGRVFEEMDSTSDGSIIKCVGNTAAAKNSVNKNDVFVNLRLKSTASTVGTSTFTVAEPVSDESFCDIDEVFDTKIQAWNVVY